MTQSNQIPLPEGYRFADKVAAQEIIDLRVACEWGRERRLEVWEAALRTSLFVSGVRDSTDELVGAGILTGSTRHALLGDLAVHPDHRGRHIGRAIVLHRLQFASEIVPGGIPFIYAEICPTNTLPSFYESLGFVSLGADNMIRLG